MTAPLRINLGDPVVQGMLVADPPHASTLATGKPRELVQIAGDVPDPTGRANWRGLQSTTSLTTGKQEVLVVYGDVLMTVDVYQVPGEPLMVHVICPRCHKTLTVRGDQKRIDFDPDRDNPQKRTIAGMGIIKGFVLGQLTGALSIEAWECTWELGDGRHAHDSLHTGASLCRQRLVIDRNRARDA